MKRLICTMLFFTVLFTIITCRNSQDGQNHKHKKNNILSSILSNTKSEETKQLKLEAELNAEVQTEVQPTKAAQEIIEQEAEMKMKIQVGDTTFTATLKDNSSVDALKELIKDSSLTLDMSDYASMEKGADLKVTLPQNNEPMNTQAGDIVLYQGRTFVIYYDTNSWSLTPIGKIDNVSVEELREILGTGDITVVLSLENE